MEAGLTKPIFWGRVLVEFIAVGAIGFLNLEGPKGTVVVEKDGIPVVDKDGGGTD